ncbi:MAG: hypothetical protein RLZZ293_433, partial [Pseudomonadota bacterium]
MNKTKFLSLSSLVSLVIALTMVGCGSSGTGSSSAGGNNSLSSGGLVANSTAVIPVLGNQGTTTQLFFHNTSDQAINQINFSSSLSLDTTACKNIAPHGSCSINITTPSLTGK